MESADTLTAHRPAGFDDWNAVLLDTLLPTLEGRAVPVLLDCDDDAVATAGAKLGYASTEAARRFGAAVEARFHIGATGSVEAVRGPTIQFRNSKDRAQRVPPFLAVCAVMVLAASHMTAAEGLATSSYYKRLWEVLGASPPPERPTDFEYAPLLFSYLQSWLSDDLEGARGELVLRESGLRRIGPAINQCVFRQRDKELLAGFFAHRVGGLGRQLDLLRLLQVSSERHQLTRPAAAVVAEDDTWDLARAALEQVYRQWDGTVPDSEGGRSLIATLRLSVNRQPKLSASAPASDPSDPGDFVEVDFSNLDELAANGLRLDGAYGRGLFLPKAGDTMVFELKEDSGLVWARSPLQETVWVLTRDPAVRDTLTLHPDATALHEPTNGPEWWLFGRVQLNRLPLPTLDIARGNRPPVALVGGLKIPGGYLVGFPPHIEVGAVELPLNVRVNGDLVGAVASGRDLKLDIGEGDHRIEVGDGLVDFEVHMMQRNPVRPDYGQLGCSLRQQGLRSGASSRPDSPSVCGAQPSTPRNVPLPFLIRGRSLFAITSSGIGLRAEAPPPPRWLSRVGLNPDAARWEAELDDDVVWLFTAGRAVLFKADLPSELDRSAAAAVRRLGPTPMIQGVTRALDAEAKVAYDLLWELAVSVGDSRTI